MSGLHKEGHFLSFLTEETKTLTKVFKFSNNEHVEGPWSYLYDLADSGKS